MRKWPEKGANDDTTECVIHAGCLRLWVCHFYYSVNLKYLQ